MNQVALPGTWTYRSLLNNHDLTLILIPWNPAEPTCCWKWVETVH